MSNDGHYLPELGRNFTLKTHGQIEHEEMGNCARVEIIKIQIMQTKRKMVTES